MAPETDLSQDEVARYARQLALPGVGLAGQQRLRDARVLVVGAGGLGSPVLLYLAAAGVGTLGIVDDDVVDTSNLHRQVIHGDAQVGRPKVGSARDAVARVNPHVRVEEHGVRLDASNAVDLLARYDVVVDGTDSFDARYLVSDAAEVVGVPVVWGAIHQYSGQVAVFAARGLGDAPGVTYRDVFPEPPPPGTVPDCATAGVFGVVCGTVGTAMATEVVKLVTGVGRTLLGRLAVYDALDGEWRYLTVRADPARTPVTSLAEREPVACAVPASAVPRDRMDVAELTDRLGRGDVVVVDVREDWELVAEPFDPGPGADVRHLPFGRVSAGDADAALADLPRDGVVAVLCKAGPRAERVAEVARAAGVDARVVDGGMLAWRARTVPAR
ncbi:ThiF family adenylyltransferase [Luteimicrobium sp. DT211]|uniref:ThiF family adenylyltransferase n=1 Tax=Luteimicrobium sp. DT211 TaxID=3393412 RepID=UPI003CF8C835